MACFWAFLAYGHMRDIQWNSVLNSLSYDIVRFKIELGVDAKLTSK